MNKDFKKCNKILKQFISREVIRKHDTKTLKGYFGSSQEDKIIDKALNDFKVSTEKNHVLSLVAYMNKINEDLNNKPVQRV